MIDVSTSFRQKLANDERNYLEYADITLTNGTVLNLTNENIWVGGFSVEDAVSQDNVFQVGCAIVNKATLVINNIYDDYSTYDFTGASVVLRLGLNVGTEDEPTIVSFTKGTYTEYETKYNDSLITISMYDNMYKFDKAYTTNLQYPLRLIDILSDACQTVGVTLATTSFSNMTIPIKTQPEQTTFREVVSWIACMAGCFARCNTFGELELKWFDTAEHEQEESVADGGVFDASTPYSSGDSYDGGAFNPWNTGDVLDGGLLANSYGAQHIISRKYSGETAVDDIVITGVKVTIKSQESTGESITEYISGTEGYTVKVSDNGFITEENAQFITNFLGGRLNGLQFRSMDIAHPSDPTIEAGDTALYIDRKGNSYKTLITRTTFTVGDTQNTVCGAEAPARNSAERFSERTKTYVELRKIAEEAIDDSAFIAFKNGEYAQFVTQTNQGISSKITTFYQASAPTASATGDLWIDTDDGNKLYRWDGTNWTSIQDAQIQSALTAASSAQTTADRKIVTFAQTSAPTGTAGSPLDVGDLWIDTDDNNKMYRWNSVQWIAVSDSSALQTWINGSYSATIQDIRDQIDGKAEVWYQSTDPSTSWSATDKPNHKGDLWYKTSDGTTWVYDGSDWIEQTVPESIFDRIDGKAQIYVGTTIPADPNAGDLWFKSANDPILTYVNNQWVTYNNYANASVIDDLLAEEVSKFQIGGTNLLRNTKDYFFTEDEEQTEDVYGLLYAQNCLLAGLYKECAIARYDNTEGSSMIDILAWHGITVELGKTYTLSFWAMSNDIQDPTIYTYFYGATGYPTVAKGVSSTGTENYNTDGAMPFTLTSEWTRYWVKWTISDTGDVEIPKWVLFRISSLASVAIAGVKLEEGGVNTYYSPSPYDISEEMDALRKASRYGICETSSDTIEKEVTLQNFVLSEGVQVAVTFVNGNDADSMMMDINGTGLKVVVANNDQTISGKLNFPSGTTASFIYDGTMYRLLATDNLYNVIQWTEESGLNIRAQEGSLSRVNISNSSVDVYASNGDLGTSTNSDGFEVYKSGTRVAKFGERSVIGEKNSGSRIEVDRSAIEFYEKAVRTAYLAEDKFYFINGEVTQAFFFPQYAIRQDTNQNLVITKR